MKTNKPVILLLLNGIGLSLAWKGNAIMTVKPKNFFDLWNNYKHYAITPLAGGMRKEQLESDPALAYTTLALGKAPLSNKALVDEAIRDQQLSNNIPIQKVISKINKQKSTLHFVGTISKNSENGDLRQLLALVAMAKSNHAFRIFIHLVADDTYESRDYFQAKIAKLEEELEHIGAGEIISIAGVFFLKSADRINSLISNIFIGSGKKYLSANQIAGTDERPEKIEPSIVDKKFTGPIVSDFDGIIFFNHSNKILSSLVSAFLSKNYLTNTVKMPRFLEVLALTEFPSPYLDQIGIAFPRINNSYLVDELVSAGKKVEIITESSKLPDLKFYFLGNKEFDMDTVYSDDSKDYLNKYQETIKSLFSKVIKAVRKNEADLIIADIPVFEKIGKFGDFEKTLKAIERVDEYLGLLEKEVFSSSDVLIISSLYGMIEGLVASDADLGNNYNCKPTFNFTPFIVVSPETKIKFDSALKKPLEIEDFMSSGYSISCIAPYIKNILRVR